MEIYIYVTVIALLDGVLSGIVGTGSSLLLMPVMVSAFGPKVAIPIMAFAVILGNFSRIVVWWNEIDWRATVAYTIPAASLGAHMLLVLPTWTIEGGIGYFFLDHDPYAAVCEPSR